MTLADGIAYYKQYSDSDWDFTLTVETASANVVRLISQFGNKPDQSALVSAYELLKNIEKWKAMCLKDRMGNAEKNSPGVVWEAFRGALTAETDLHAILSIMQLTGFGSSRDEESGQRRAKVATAALRFLQPGRWGVVDWRTAAMLGMIQKTHGDVDTALTLAQHEDAHRLRAVFDIIDENGACAFNQMYRDRRSVWLQRTADVEMAVFGLSLLAWPIPRTTFA